MGGGADRLTYVRAVVVSVFPRTRKDVQQITAELTASCVCKSNATVTAASHSDH